MTDKWYEMFAGIALAILAVVVAIRIFVSIPGIDATNANTAAWVQAVGSIAAIIAAFLIPMYQHRQVEKAADDERALNKIILLNSIQNLVLSATVHVQNAHDAFCSDSNDFLHSYFVVRYGKGDLADVAEALGQVPLHVVPADVFGLIPLRRVLLRLEEYLEHFATGQYTDEDYRNMVERLRKDLKLVLGVNEELKKQMLSAGRSVRDRSRVVGLFKQANG